MQTHGGPQLEQSHEPWGPHLYVSSYVGISLGSSSDGECREVHVGTRNEQGAGL